MSQYRDKSCRKKLYALLIILIVVTSFMIIIDFIIKPEYAIKSICKIILFVVIPIVYLKFYGKIRLKDILTPRKKGIKHSILLGLLLYVIILGSFLIARNFLDFSTIIPSLKEANIDRSIFIYVALYIAFINSFIEEFFFRGFIFFSLLEITDRKWAYLIGSMFFAYYHMGMLTSMMNIVILIVSVVSLVVAGYILSYINEKNKNIYASWIVHMFANFSINTIGLTLFGII